MVIKCDVLVVGAGPAGSSAARAAALNGAKTILIEKDPAAGMNIQCAESISKYLMPYLPFPIPKEQLIWEIRGMLFWAENMLIKKEGEKWGAYNINREKFDRWLADEAVRAGAKFFTDTKLVHLDFDNEYIVKKAFVKTPKGENEIRPKVIIAADGVKSTVARRLGVMQRINEGDIAEVVAYDMRNLKLDNPHYDQIFLGDFAPGSYAYILPKSKNVASLGVGTIIDKTKRQLEKHFNDFINHKIVKHQIKDAIIIDEKSGEAPMRQIIDKWVYGNVIFTGDAANQNIKPLAEGILPGIICGDIAGKVASDFVKKNSPLEKYEKLVYDKMGDFFRLSNDAIDVMCSMPLDPKEKKTHLLHMGLFLGIFNKKYIKSLQSKNYNFIRKKIIKLK